MSSERVKEEIKEKEEQISKQIMNDIRSYYFVNRKSVVDLPSKHPNAFIALTYVITFIAGGQII